jgi:carboxylesterase
MEEGFLKEGNDIGVLVIHGFTGSPGSMRDLANFYVDRGFTVALPRLSGHGTTPQDLENRKYQEWINDVEQAYGWLKERTKKIFVTGLSMGGTLTLYMGEQHKEIAGLITINAAVKMPNETSMVVLGTLGIPRFVKGIGSDIKKGIKEPAYELTPLRASKQLALLMRLVRHHIKDVDEPILIFSSKEDHVVPPENQRWIYDNVSSKVKQLISLENSYHVATMDYDLELIEQKSLEFIEELK